MGTNGKLKCGVKFCGGCNPRYERGAALTKLKEHFKDRVCFLYAEENVLYDIILVIGGCTNCCASCEQYMARKGVLKMWDETHIENIIPAIEMLDTMEEE